MSARHAVELDEHQPVGEVDGVVEERLGDHERGAEDRALRVRAEDQAQERDVAVPLLGNELERLRVVDGLELLARLSHGLLDLRKLSLGLLHAAVGHEPARALGEGARHDEDDESEHGAHQEREPPPDVRGERVQEDERDERAEDRAGPVAAVDPDVDTAAILRGHHLVDRGVDGRVLAADSHARDEPRPVEVDEPQPAAVVHRERRKPCAEEVQEERDDEEPLPPELIRHPPEDERTHDLADEVHRRDQPDLGRGHVERVGLDEDTGHGARDRDLEAVEDPGGPEPGDHPRVERRPAQAIEPRRDRGANRPGFGSGGAHLPCSFHESSSSSSATMIRPAASISARCENACGKLPRWRPVATSNSSA